MNSVGRTIQYLRRAKGVTQEKMAQQIGVSFQAISKWENEYTLPDIMLLPVIATVIQVLMTKVSMKGSSTEMTGSSRTMMIMMPLMTLWMGYILPAALCVYWIAQSAFSLLQELTLNKYFNKILDREETDKERAKREARYAKYEKQKEMMAQQQARANGGNGSRGTSTSKKKQQQYRASGEKKQPGTNENGRIGNRPYARGRAFSEDHYAD